MRPLFGSVLFLLVVLGLAAITVWPSQTPQRGLASAANPLAERDGRIAELEQRLRLLERRAVAPDPMPATALPSRQDHTEALDREAEAHAEARVAVYEEKLDGLASAESLDDAWTATATAGVEARLGSLAQRVSLESVRCGTTLCTVTVTHDDGMAHTYLVEALLHGEHAAPGFGGRSMVRRHDLPDGTYRSVIYMARLGADLPKMDGS